MYLFSPYPVELGSSMHRFKLHRHRKIRADGYSNIRRQIGAWFGRKLKSLRIATWNYRFITNRQHKWLMQILLMEDYHRRMFLRFFKFKNQSLINRYSRKIPLNGTDRFIWLSRSTYAVQHGDYLTLVIPIRAMVRALTFVTNRFHIMLLFTIDHGNV